VHTQSIDKIQNDIEALSFISGRLDSKENQLGRLGTRDYDIDEVIKEAEDEMLEDDVSRLGRQSFGKKASE